MGKKRLRKRNGNLMGFFIPIISVFAIAVVTYGALYVSEALFVKEQVNQICRNAILQMESIGYLDSDTRIEAESRLKELGIESVDFSGSTFSEVAYGEEIRLEVSGYLPLKQMIADAGIMDTVVEEKKIAFSEVRVSTGKH